MMNISGTLTKRDHFIVRKVSTETRSMEFCVEVENDNTRTIVGLYASRDKLLELMEALRAAIQEVQAA